MNHHYHKHKEEEEREEEKYDKPSFFEKMFGKKRQEDYDEDYEEEAEYYDEDDEYDDDDYEDSNDQKEQNYDKTVVKDLPIDLIETEDGYILYAIVAGVHKEKIDIDITHEIVKIKIDLDNKYQESKDSQYIYNEIENGKFIREIILTTEIEVDDAFAEIKNGILKIILPKINKKKKKQLKIN